MKKVNGLISADITEKFPSGFCVEDLFDYVSNKVNIEGILSVAGILCPDFIIEDNYVLLGSNYSTYLRFKGNMPFGNDKISIERFVNNLSLSDFFYEKNSDNEVFLILPSEEDIFLYVKFAYVLKFFWERRLKEIFPEKIFCFEISDDGILDEDGVCITFYETSH